MKELFSNSRHDNELKRDVAELKNRMDAVEHLLDNAKDVLTLEEAAAFMGMKKSTLYKLTHEQAIPYWKPISSTRLITYRVRYFLNTPRPLFFIVSNLLIIQIVETHFYFVSYPSELRKNEILRSLAL